MSEWINIEDEWPRGVGTKVFVYSSTGGADIAELYVCPEYGNSWFLDNEDEDYPHTVTHWQPLLLPESPTE